MVVLVFTVPRQPNSFSPAMILHGVLGICESGELILRCKLGLHRLCLSLFPFRIVFEMVFRLSLLSGRTPVFFFFCVCRDGSLSSGRFFDLDPAPRLKEKEYAPTLFFHFRRRERGFGRLDLDCRVFR